MRTACAVTLGRIHVSLYTIYLVWATESLDDQIRSVG